MIQISQSDLRKGAIISRSASSCPFLYCAVCCSDSLPSSQTFARADCTFVEWESSLRHRVNTRHSLIHGFSLKAVAFCAFQYCPHRLPFIPQLICDWHRYSTRPFRARLCSENDTLSMWVWRTKVLSLSQRCFVSHAHVRVAPPPLAVFPLVECHPVPSLVFERNAVIIGPSTYSEIFFLISLPFLIEVKRYSLCRRLIIFPLFAVCADGEFVLLSPLQRRVGKVLSIRLFPFVARSFFSPGNEHFFLVFPRCSSPAADCFFSLSPIGDWLVISALPQSLGLPLVNRWLDSYHRFQFSGSVLTTCR